MSDTLIRALGPITVARRGDGQPTSMTLDNPGFAQLFIVIICGVIIISAVWRWARRKE